MNKYDMLSIIRRKTTYICPSIASKIYPNVINQNFKANNINEKWSTDITYIITPESRLYLCVIKDLYDKSIVAYEYSQNMSQWLVLKTVKQALRRKGKNNLILHSDQGAQYSSLEYNKMLLRNNIIPSMSRRATPFDNAPIESFFSILKTECIYLEKPKTVEEAKYLCDNFIEYYNTERIQLYNGLTPLEIRKTSQSFN